MRPTSARPAGTPSPSRSDGSPLSSTDSSCRTSGSAPRRCTSGTTPATRSAPAAMRRTSGTCRCRTATCPMSNWPMAFATTGSSRACATSCTTATLTTLPQPQRSKSTLSFRGSPSRTCLAPRTSTSRDTSPAESGWTRRPSRSTPSGCGTAPGTSGRRSAGACRPKALAVMGVTAGASPIPPRAATRST